MTAYDDVPIDAVCDYCGELQLYCHCGEKKPKRLWCMHVLGPDDVHAAPSRRAAQRACDKYNAHFAGKYPDVLLRFEVAEWPHSPESHAEDLKRWNTEISPPPPNARGNWRKDRVAGFASG